RWMAEKRSRARGEAVSARLEHYDEIADVGFRHFHIFRKQIERCAERADDGNDFPLKATHAVADHDRIVLADDLSKIARGRQMVMQAAIGHEKNMPPRQLSVDDARHVDARLADEESSQFDHDFCLSQAGIQAIQDAREVGADCCEIELLVAREVGNAEAAADVENSYRSRRMPSK